MKLELVFEWKKTTASSDQFAELWGEMRKMSEAMDRLAREVSESRSAIGSAKTFIQGIRDRLDAAGLDQQKLDDLAADLDAQQAELAAAITDNTPAAPVAEATVDEVPNRKSVV